MGKYPAAIRLEQSAIATWQKGPASLVARLGPSPDMGMALADLGGAQMLAGELPKALETLNAAVKANPGNAAALYRRARVRDLSGQSEAALADYSLASRAAFAATQDLASGEAHLYRGVFLYKRREFARAEDEFASALNFDISGSLRADAQAWRHLAAVAGGSCNSAKESLGRSLGSVSPYFPTAEAMRLASTCNGTER
jgi:tetratricopeptide (TPR) repeat protein